jgi:hypothetical protein
MRLPFLLHLSLIIIIISGSTVFVSTLAASHRRFRNLIKPLGRTPLGELSARTLVTRLNLILYNSIWTITDNVLKKKLFELLNICGTYKFYPTSIASPTLWEFKYSSGQRYYEMKTIAADKLEAISNVKWLLLTPFCARVGECAPLRSNVFSKMFFVLF